MTFSSYETVEDSELTEYQNHEKLRDDVFEGFLIRYVEIREKTRDIDNLFVLGVVRNTA